jgi:hypothetical protein
MLAYQLARPVSYLVIHDQSKWKTDWIVPGICVFITALLYLFLPERPPIFGSSGVLWQLSGLLQILPGFYIASLAAIATFNKDNMDQYMPEPTPTVNVTVRGQSFPIRLTRRRMLSLMFGYLAFLSLMLFLIIIAANYLAPSIKVWLPKETHAAAILSFIIVYGLMFWNLVAVTL